MKFTPRILALMSVVVLLSAVLIVPALAAPIDYNDYVTKVEVDGENDLVTVTIPAEMAFVIVFDENNNEYYRGMGKIHDFVMAEEVEYYIEVCPFGYPWGADGVGLDLSQIPVGTQIASGFGFVTDPYGQVTGISYGSVSYYYFPTAYYTATQPDMVDERFFTDVHIVESVDNAEILRIHYLVNYETVSSPVASIYVEDTKMVFSISSLLRQQQATGKTNALLKEVESQLVEQGKTLDDIKQQQQQTNDKLDDIINGGSAGEDLIDKNDQLTDIGDDLKENMDQIQDFEDQYFGQFEDNLGDVVDAADISFLYVPLGFVQRYLNKIVAAIPSKYLVVFTLPMLFGLFLYIVGHPVRAPRPERKSDSESRKSMSASRSPAAAPQKEVKS